MKKYLFAASLLGLSLGSAMAQDKAGPDHVFVTKAAMSNMFEIESSKVAVEKAKDPEIKKFAQQMISDHTKAGKEMMAVAPDAPKELDAAHLAKVEKLKEAEGEKFDAAYIDEQVVAHDEAVALFTKFSTEAETPKLKEFAAKTLPTLKEHQEHVKDLNNK
ncbi:DUF4142 domain-containing protein [Flaviflagellibacter deserti]|uniref:DUF4142 domain-containing protein n=1 Tax=Flaviflagellibacter deserti TaxID=2267266 RepID=A0ABV9Z4W3_9HYPH